MSQYRIAVIVGSLRKDSFNRKLASALSRLGPADFSFETSRIDDLPLYNQDDDADPADPVKRLKSEITAAQGLLFVTPEYNLSLIHIFPVFLSLLKGVAPERRRLVLLRELLIALLVLFAFLLGGQYILKLLQLKQESVSIAGGIILFLIGVKMVFPPKEGGIFGHADGGEPFIVPMAIPGVAGPSAMAALLLLTNTQPGKLPQWALALFAAWLATALILWSATYLYRLLGESVLTALERLMGMILIALSVQMLLDGIAKYLHATPL